MKQISRVCLSIALLASTVLELRAATHYVATTGTDSGSGTSANPWKTVAYAAAHDTASGDVIQVGAGTFAETTYISLAPGVSLQGAGAASTTITTTSSPTGTGTVSFLLALNSSTITSGANQSISGITFDGLGHTVNIGIYLSNRSDVTIHDIVVQDCCHDGLLAAGPSTTLPTWPTMPSDSQMISNIQIYDSTFLNSGQVQTGQDWAYGTIYLLQIRDSSVHHCTFDESDYGGFDIKGAWGERVKIFNCHLQEMAQWPNATRGKGFGIEFWYLDNSEVFDNTTNGGISVSSTNTTFHHNYVVMPDGEGKCEGFEYGGGSTQLFQNYLEGAQPGMAVWGLVFPGLVIHNNVFRGDNGGVLVSSSAVNPIGGLAIYNNTLDQCFGIYGESSIGMRIEESGGSIDSVLIKNNIIANPQSTSGISLTGINGSATYVSAITNTTMAYNLFYQTVGADIVDKGSIGAVTASNLDANPLFVGGPDYPSPYYGLQASSPAKSSGVNVGLPYFGTAPDRGAFVADTSLGAHIEAETSYTVASNAGSTSSIGVGSMSLASQGRAVSLSTIGDAIRVYFYAPEDGTYTLDVRLRSGNTLSSTNYFTGRYTFAVDSTIPVTLTGNPSTVSSLDPNGGGVYWGTMSGSIPLTAGPHCIQITAAYAYGMIDYVSLH